MRVLITGVTGFIGSHLAELSLGCGDQVWGATDQGKWRSTVPPMLPQAVRLLAWDIKSPAPPDVVAAIAEFAPSVVFHLAGISIPSKCGDGIPSPCATAVNVTGTRHVIDLALDLPSRPRLIFASTCHVYAHVTSTAPIVDESAKIDPVTAYGHTKLAAEGEILKSIREDRLDACIVRGFHHIGRRQPSGLMLTDWLEQLLDDSTATLRVRCRNSYVDVVDVRDASRAYRLLAERGTAGHVYNLGSGQVHRSGDILECVLAHTDREVTVIELSTDEQWNAIADVRKLRSLGWRPEVGYQQTIADMIPRQLLHIK